MANIGDAKRNTEFTDRDCGLNDVAENAAGTHIVAGSSLTG
jgi:hypothetical protein